MFLQFDPDSWADGHWGSQYIHAVNDDNKIIVDFVGKYENMENDLKKISKIIGLNLNIIIDNPSPNRKRKTYDQYYNNETKRIVTKRYNKDINLSSYSFT